MSKRLKPFDATWLLMQSESTPMHVASLFIFEKPADASPTYLRDIVEHFRTCSDFVPPWNYKLKQGLFAGLLPSWVEDNDLDIDYHLRHSALPEPGGERELGILVSRLHSHPLDLSRPLWEIHLVEGLENNRFAMYVKIHHSLIDGVSGMRMIMRALSADPATRGMAPLWTNGAGGDSEKPPAADRKPRAKVGLKTSIGGLAESLRRTARAAMDEDDALVAPYASPHSILSGPMNGQRRFATQQVELARLKGLAKTAGGTLNDVVLYLCGTVLRRYLKESEQLPKKSLTATVPVNLREAGDESLGGTQIGTLYVKLGTDIADPRKRLEAVKLSSEEAKRHLQAMPRSMQLPYTLLTAAPSLLAQAARLDDYMPPLFSLGISNVPGPPEPLYFDGARLQAMYPISLLMRGGALNITCVSCDGMLNFGFTGARDSLPHLQRMAVYLGEAVDELEALLVR